MNILSLFAGVLTMSITLGVMFTFTNCGQGLESNNANSEVSIVYLGDDGRPMQKKLPYEIKGDDVIVYGDIIVGQKSSLEKNGNKFIVNFARSKYEDFEYKLNLENSNGQQVVALQSVKDNYTTNWPGGIVPIRIVGKVPNLKNIISNIDSFNQLMVKNNIKVKLVHRTNEDVYVSLRNSYSACSASIGYKSSANINLSTGCSSQKIVHHEILHVLGFKHEQSRSDRDEHVVIHNKNIIDGKHGNFAKLDNSFNYTGYDYSSIMHYDGRAFSKNGEQTITRRHSNESVIVQNSFLSKGDFAGLLELYEKGTYTNVKELASDPIILALINEPTKPITVGSITGTKPPHIPKPIKPTLAVTFPVRPLPSQAAAVPSDLIEGRQYIADGFRSKVYMHKSGQTCYVPDGYFKSVIEKSQKWIDQLISSTKSSPKKCNMAAPVITAVAENKVSPPKGLVFEQQYIAHGFTSKVLKITKNGICQVPDGYFYDVKEVSQNLIDNILGINEVGEPLKGCAIN